jgi:hypothetical protein
MKRASPWWLLLLLPLLWLAPLLGDPTQVHAPPGGQYSDLFIAHWPSAEFIRNSLRQFGEIPLWNPHLLGGTPFAADPLSGLYYPPLWLAFLLPAPLAFNILFFLHLAFAGIGAFLLAHEESAGGAGGWIGPLLAGIAFGGLPKFIAHVAAGHLTLVLAVSWTPWLLLAARQAARRRSVRRWSLAGVMAGIVFLADPRWSIPSALAAAGYAFCCGSERQSNASRRARILGWIRDLAVFAVFAAAVAAVLALPMAEFASLSTRVDLPEAERAVYSLPFASLGGWLFGGIEGYIEWVVYPGIVVLGMAFVAVLSPASRAGSAEIGAEGGKRFWLFLLLLSVILSLGSNLPGVGAFSGAVPGLNLLRVPPRWMFLAGLSLAMLAARGPAALAAITDGRGILKKTGFALAAGGGAFAAAAGFLGWPAVLWQDGLMWCALGVILFVGFSPGRWSIPATGALLVLAAVDLAVADGRMIDPHPAEPVSVAAAEAASAMVDDPGAYRVYSPSASIPQLAAVQSGLRLLDGINPLILRSTADTVSAAARVPSAGYSVTLPNFKTGSPETDNRGAIPDLRLLGLLNVRYIASAFGIPDATLLGCEQIGGIHLCRNMFVFPRAWVAEGAGTWNAPVAGQIVRIDTDSPNRIRMTASGPGIVVLAEAWYPAWRAAVDGKPAEVMQVGGWWRAVEIGPGEHVVEMRYDPLLSRIGLALCALALLACGAVKRWAA